MTAKFGGAGIAWIRREDYAAVRELMLDGDEMPATYDQWLEKSERIAAEFERRGTVLSRAYLDPKTFAAWCAARGLDVDSQGRRMFAADPANWANKH